MVTTLYKLGTRNTRKTTTRMKFGMAAVASVIPACTGNSSFSDQPAGRGRVLHSTTRPLRWLPVKPGTTRKQLRTLFSRSFYPTVESLTVPLAECVGTVTCTFEQQRTSMCLLTIKCTITNLLHPSVILCWLTSTPHLLPGTGGYMHTINSKIYRKWL